MDDLNKLNHKIEIKPFTPNLGGVIRGLIYQKN